MAASKKRQDEKHLKILREMVGLPHNKHCFDCHQRGPTYVNTTIGAFVCTSCSGILRGLNPPQRVKSISMTSFTPDEIDNLKSQGNDFCRKVYLGLYDSRTNPEPDSKDEQKIKDFMIQKYEKKRWYVAPTEAMKEEARRQNETSDKKPETKPLKSLLGNNIPKLHTPNGSVQNRPVSSVPPVQRPNIQASIQHSQPQKQPVKQDSVSIPAASSGGGGGGALDLLADFGGDPFANNTAVQPAPPAPAAPAGDGGGFANFESAFGSSHFGGPTASTTQTFGAFTSSSLNQGGQNTVMSPSGSVTSPVTVPTSNTQDGGGANDRYAALADLDSVFGGSGNPTVNWDGGSSGLWDGPKPTSNWKSSAPAQQAAPPPFGASPTTSNAFSGFATASTASNPFGTSPSSNQPASVGNPFLASSNQSSSFGAGQQQGFGGFPNSQSSQTGFGQFSTASSHSSSNAGGFGAFTAVPATNTTSSASNFGMQNGFNTSWSSNSSGGGFGNQPGQQSFFGQNSTSAANSFQSPTGNASFVGAGIATMAANDFAKQQQGFGQQQQQMFNQQQQFGGSGGWGNPTPANPFMNISQNQQGIPPRSNSTNPFL